MKYWRTTGKAEIDFIIEKNSKIIPIEVKTSGNIKKGYILPFADFEYSFDHPYIPAFLTLNFLSFILL